MGFFVLLMLVCWAMAIFGLFAPAKAMFWSNKPSRLKAMGTYLLASFLVIVAGGITSDATQQRVATPTEPAPQAKAQPGEQPAASTPLVAPPAPPAQPAARAPAPQPASSAAPAKTEQKPDAAEEKLYLAHEIAAAYRANEIAADKEFKGKRLLIGGLVRGIEKDFMGDPVVRVAAGEYDLFDVNCGFKGSETDKLSALRKGQRLYFHGEVGGTTLGILNIYRCEVVKIK